VPCLSAPPRCSGQCSLQSDKVLVILGRLLSYRGRRTTQCAHLFCSLKFQDVRALNVLQTGRIGLQMQSAHICRCLDRHQLNHGRRVRHGRRT